MKPEHVIFLILTAAAVATIALFLIAIIIELRRTYMQLIGILEAVSGTAEKTEGLESVVGVLMQDVAAGQAALADGVERLEQRLSEEEEMASSTPSRPDYRSTPPRLV